MKNEIEVGGKKASILIEPHQLENHEVGRSAEYFTASYAFEALSAGPGAVLFLDDDGKPKRFQSPVEALEYAREKLLAQI
jgi:hypothetical protein